MEILVQNRKLNNSNKIQAFVNECEMKFDFALHSLGDVVASSPEARVVTLSGPTCSGKTTTADNLVSDVIRAGRSIFTISIDDFFFDRDVMKAQAAAEGREVDFESIDAIDMELFTKCVEDIYAKKRTRLPTFDFVSGKRTTLTEFYPKDYDVILFEGIQANYPEVVALLGQYPYISISTNVRRALKVGGELFEPREIRLCRRIVRDIRKRASSAEETLKMWKTVTDNEDKNILPFENTARLKLDSLMGYELNILKEPLLEALAGIPEDSEFYPTRIYLEKKAANIDPIGKEYIPEGSMYWEFL